MTLSSLRIYRNIDCLVTNSGFLKTRGIRPTEEDLGIVYDGAIVFSTNKGVIWVGPDSDLSREYKKKRPIKCKGFTAYPGLVDSHTHPAFSGNRAKEFSMRMAGAKYQEIAAAGGGILSTVAQTRALTAADLTKLITQRLRESYNFGVRALEAKSGYGLDFDSELRSLSAINRAEKNFKKIRVLTTCMAAHAVPPEFNNNKRAWVENICEKILPIVRKKNLAHFVDVFCDEGYFDRDDTKKIFTSAKKLGFGLRLHGDELTNTGAAELASELGAHSVDHLLKISDAGIAALAASNTIATLLPGTSLFLKENTAPARKLIAAGAAVALATDFNPGTCTTQNLPFIATLGAILLEMTPAEIIAGITWNAARALGLEKKYGALQPGYVGEPIFAEGDHPAAIYYKLAAPGLPNLPSR